MITKLRGPEYIMHRYEGNPIITGDDFPVPVKAVFNCGQTMYEGKTVLLIAAIYEEKINGNETGIHVAMSEDGINFTIEKEPFCSKRDWVDLPGDYDCWVIDPRVTKIGDTYYIVRPGQIKPGDNIDIGPSAVLEKTKDFKELEFIDCIALPTNRVPCLFPEKINGMYVRLDRPYSVVRVNEPSDSRDDKLTHGMWISYSPDLIYWGHHRPLLYPPLSFANYKVGPTPPIKTKDGWLEIIHGVYLENREWCYSIGAMLLDLEDPSKVISVLDHWILTPTEPYETDGRVENVVFPCGAIADEETDTIRIYYGAADECIGLATGKLSELMDALKKEGKHGFVR